MHKRSALKLDKQWGWSNLKRRARKEEAKMSPRKKKMMKVIMVIMTPIISIAMTYGGMKLANWWDDRTVARIKASNTKTIGTIIDFGAYAIAEYHVYGIAYTIRVGKPWNVYVGEHYEVFYAEDDPQEGRMDFTVPVFLKDEVTACTTGTVYNEAFGGGMVDYRYQVDGRGFKRRQHYKEGLEVREGEKYEVEYLVKNPRIGILKLKGL